MLAQIEQTLDELQIAKNMENAIVNEQTPTMFYIKALFLIGIAVGFALFLKSQKKK